MATKKVTTSRFDAAEYLRSDEDIAAYIEAALEDYADDPAMIAVALGTVARVHGMARLAKDTGITREGLYKALSPTGNPSLATFVKVTQALGVRLSCMPIAAKPAKGRGRRAA